MTENELFNETNLYIQRGQDRAECGDARGAIRYYESAAENLKKLMTIDRAYYQKYLYAVYDEMGILSFNELGEYSRARDYLTNAYDNCKECALRDPYGAAATDLEYISSRLNSARNA